MSFAKVMICSSDNINNVIHNAEVKVHPVSLGQQIMAKIMEKISQNNQRIGKSQVPSKRSAATLN